MLAEDARERLRKQLIADEGIRLRPYLDSVGKLTIGVGRNIEDVGISALEAYDLLDHDIDRAEIGLVGQYPWFSDLDPVRQAVLIQLAFNMGLATLGKFVHTLDAFQRHDWPEVARGLRQSRWFTQVQKSRSSRLIQMVLTGEWPHV